MPGAKEFNIKFDHFGFGADVFHIKVGIQHMKVGVQRIKFDVEYISVRHKLFSKPVKSPAKFPNLTLRERKTLG